MYPTVYDERVAGEIILVRKSLPPSCEVFIAQQKVIRKRMLQVTCFYRYIQVSTSIGSIYTRALYHIQQLMYLLKISVLHSLLNGDIKKDNICPKWWVPVAERILGGIISVGGIDKNLRTALIMQD